MTDPIKSMPVFYIDNQHMWPKGSKLHGNYVVWPDAGKYPTYQPIGLAEHPQFKGKVVVQGGNRGLVVSFVAGAKSADDVRKGMSAQGVEQYRISVESIIHALMLMRADTEGGSEGDLHPLAILTMLAKASPTDAAILVAALKAWMLKPLGVEKVVGVTEALESAEEMVKALQGAEKE